jgi:divalent metal cation (Fe/Co/Zn/Cd) transporter
VLPVDVEYPLSSVREALTRSSEILAHRFGPHFVINVTVGVDGSLPVSEGDRIATGVEERLQHETAG